MSISPLFFFLDYSASIQKLEWNHRAMNHFHSILVHPTKHSLIPCRHETCTSTSYQVIHITPHFPCSLHLHFVNFPFECALLSDLFVAFPPHWFSGHEYVRWDLRQFSGSYDSNVIFLIFHWYLIVVDLKCLLSCSARFLDFVLLWLISQQILDQLWPILIEFRLSGLKDCQIFPTMICIHRFSTNLVSNHEFMTNMQLRVKNGHISIKTSKLKESLMFYDAH